METSVDKKTIVKQVPQGKNHWCMEYRAGFHPWGGGGFDPHSESLEGNIPPLFLSKLYHEIYHQGIINSHPAHAVQAG